MLQGKEGLLETGGTAAAQSQVLPCPSLLFCLLSPLPTPLFHKELHVLCATWGGGGRQGAPESSTVGAGSAHVKDDHQRTQNSPAKVSLKVTDPHSQLVWPVRREGAMRGSPESSQ